MNIDTFIAITLYSDHCGWAGAARLRSTEYENTAEWRRTCRVIGQSGNW